MYHLIYIVVVVAIFGLWLYFTIVSLLNHSFYVDDEADEPLRMNVTAIEHINSWVDNTMMTAEIHDQHTIKYLNKLGNELREKFFSMIDTYAFNIYIPLDKS